MKALNFIITLLIVAAIIGCQDQGKDSHNKQKTIPKSGELVFGDKKATYIIEGEGIPCFVCADGTQQINCLSDSLKKHFQFIFLEQRHSTYYDEPRDYSGITMDTIIQDIELLREKLDLKKVYLLGHSIVGLIALDYARDYPENTLGVIMINTPPVFPEDYWSLTTKMWEEDATEDRKLIFKEKQEQLEIYKADSSLSELELIDLWIKADVPRFWYDPNYDVSEVYKNYRLNSEGWNYFYSIMYGYDITRTEIDIPIFLSLGSFDFVMPPYLWDDFIDHFPTLTVKHFKKSGHYPQVEEQESFDKELLSWLYDN